MTIIRAITTVVGTFVSAATQATNWTRYARSGGQAAWACIIGFFVNDGMVLLFGAIGAITFGRGDFVRFLYNVGLIGWSLILVFGNLWKSNAESVCTFGVAGAETFRHPGKALFIISGCEIAPARTGWRAQPFDRLPELARHLHSPLGGVLIGDLSCRWRRGIPAGHTHLLVH